MIQKYEQVSSANERPGNRACAFGQHRTSLRNSNRIWRWTKEQHPWNNLIFFRAIFTLFAVICSNLFFLA